MNPDNVIPKLSSTTVMSIQHIMLDVCLSFYMGGDYKLLLLREKNSAIGIRRKSIEKIENADDAGLRRLAFALLS